jgi:rhomboid protease GluP
MFKRQRTGSVICTSCGVLVGVNDDRCYNCGRRNPGLWGFAPLLRSFGTDMGFVPFIIGTCVIIYALTLIYSIGSIGMQGIGFFVPSDAALLIFGASGPLPVFGFGRWWTVLSAAWLHGSILHILFNMMAVRQLAPATSDMYGPGRMVIIYTASAIGGFLLSTIAGRYFPDLLILRPGRFYTVGASASISGLLGAILYYGHRSGSSVARGYATQNAIGLVLIGILMPAIDNYAHMGGFATGYLVGRFLDPLKHERGDHVALAIACVVLSVLSIIVSVLTVVLGVLT